MKNVLLLLGALLLSHISQAQNTINITGALAATDPTIPGQRSERNGLASSCAAPKPFPGYRPDTGVPYRAYSLTNTSGSSTCVTVTEMPTCTSGESIFVTAYADNFNPNDVSQNYLADIGGSPRQNLSGSFSFTVNSNQTFIIVVSGLTSTTACDNYTLDVKLDAPLPVELSSFTGRPIAGGNRLAWTTASELHNARFIVERSADGRQFAALGEVAGAGTTLQPRSYTYLDAQPLALSYYRLRQVDEDGKFQFSSVIVVRASSSAFTFAPNPVASQATFYCPTATTLSVRDALGRLCQVLHLVAGSQQVALDALPAGVYSLTDDTTHQTARLIKASN